MKKMITVNYWMMSIAWSLCLTDMSVWGLALAALTTIVLSALRKGINVWRVLSNALLAVIVMYPIYFFSNIHYYFPSLSVFLTIVSFNSAIANEYLCMYKTRYILPYIVTMTAGLMMLALIIVVLPGNDYSLFTKQSLAIMNGFIFLPYLVRPVLCIIIRALKKSFIVTVRALAMSK